LIVTKGQKSLSVSIQYFNFDGEINESLSEILQHKDNFRKMKGNASSQSGNATGNTGVKYCV